MRFSRPVSVWGSIAVWLIATLNSQAQLVVLSSAESGGPTPQQLAEVVDQSSGVQIVPASTATIINGGGNSSLRAMALFSGGLTPAGTFLPSENQPDPNNPTVAYAGGIGIASGVCLCTGLTSDSDPSISPGSVPAGLRVGVQGPNNGHPLNIQGVIGEVDFDLGTPEDNDFVNVVASGSNATVLSFDIELESPGILQITYVHGTDEHPQYNLGTFNDTFLVFVRHPDCPNPQFENFIVFRGRNPNTGDVEENTLNLAALQACGFFKENLVAPEPEGLTSSPHANVGTEDRYDHEFGGFSKPLTFESISPLATSPLYRKVFAPGVYNVKLVIQDVGANDDPFIDSAAFIKEHSLQGFSFLPADFDLDGDIDGRDYLTWSRNYGTSPATFTQGDANGDCIVNSADLQIWGNNYGQSGGNANYCTDFNRNGMIDGQDFLIWQRNFGLEHCASRFQGDADGDGDGDSCDLSIWHAEYGSGPLAVCACESEQQMALAASDGSEDGFDPADANQDGKVDQTDIGQLIELWTSLEK